MGYQTLPVFSAPYAQANTAMARLPAIPPFTPAEIGYVCTGSHARNWSVGTGIRSTILRFVLKRIYAGTIGKASSCSCGRTSRNHPTQAESESAAPNRLIDRLVTRPANSNVTPVAKK